MEIINTILVSMHPNNFPDDVLIWVKDSHGVFSIRNAWDSIWYRQPEVDWCRSVWFAKAAPRHAFILQLAIRGALVM